jgi:inner membrane protein
MEQSMKYEVSGEASMNKVLVQKALTIAALACVILIALFMVGGVISDRQKYRDAAVKSIEASYAGPQTVVGPVLVRPYTQTIAPGGTMAARNQDLTDTSFPRELELRGAMIPSERRHGLFKVEVFEFQGTLKGTLQVVDPLLEGTVNWGEPYLALAVTDVRGIVGTPKVTVNGIAAPILQSAPDATGLHSNLRIPLRGISPVDGRYDFTIDLNLSGTERFGVAPLGNSNHVEIQSSWKSPLFGGQFLPRTRDVSSNGFRAAWDISSLASGAQAQLEAGSSKPLDGMNVSLTTLVDPYTLSDRAVKYGVLFVMLTFGGFLIFELMKQLPIHPVQYLLVGFGLAIFFLLLVSFSEHVAFGYAYVIASVACIGLLSFYLSYVLRSTGRGLGFGAMLTTLYTSMYGLLISEDIALLLGSIMLFCLLAAVMFVTRNVDWYRGTAEPWRPEPLETIR